MKHTPLKKVSNKMAKQKRQERQLKTQLFERCKGLCEDCGQPPDFRGLSKHEIVYRSRGGNPLDPDNCKMLCGTCHSKRHGLNEIKEFLN